MKTGLLLAKLDELIVHNFGSLSDALGTIEGKSIVSSLMAEENRVELRQYFGSTAMLNSLAKDVKAFLELQIGEPL